MGELLAPLSGRAAELEKSLEDFVETKCIPAEELFESQLGQGANRWKVVPAVMEELKVEARRRGLWNLWLPKEFPQGAGLTNSEYAVLAVVMLLGGFMWAFIIGAVCGTVSTMDIKRIEFQQKFDQVNFMLSDLAIDHPLAIRVRAFLLQCEERERRSNYSTLFEDLSEQLQADLVEEIRRTKAEESQAAFEAAQVPKAALATAQLESKTVSIEGHPHAVYNGVYTHDSTHEGWPVLKSANGKFSAGKPSSSASLLLERRSFALSVAVRDIVGLQPCAAAVFESSATRIAGLHSCRSCYKGASPSIASLQVYPMPSI